MCIIVGYVALNVQVSEMVSNSHSERRTATTVEGILPYYQKQKKKKEENEMSSSHFLIFSFFFWVVRKYSLYHCCRMALTVAVTYHLTHLRIIPLLMISFYLISELH